MKIPKTFTEKNHLEKILQKKQEQPEYKEMIIQKFGNIFECIHKTSYIYGGAIRDLVAYERIEGDLDIAIKERNYRMTRENITTKLPDYEITQPKEEYDFYGDLYALNHQEIYKKGDEEIHMVFLSGSNPISIAEEVDFICCGLVMNKEGEISEILNGAYDDCKNKVLRLNDKATIMGNLKKRIDHLTKRGWEFKL